MSYLNMQNFIQKQKGTLKFRQKIPYIGIFGFNFIKTIIKF